ncbi:hypothetical protein IU447_27665 [Nocardia farcinica]|uniref:Uncharacterized protein n=1 Tax=Nocardia farcinica TaxID=37329 RepID=A0A449G632_NOCFR|nr:hypothetical protein [Nocardia farcinica]MBF6363888.1 hypothetical protein [Nocardia farcinica]VFA91228.1 Uncharacterised protein [Nocardia farcinica]VFA96130.1 Uncharacterised protein [Nocardia farcinica]
MSWRDSAPELVQNDLDGLLDSALSLAEQHLAERGGFFPFAMTVGLDGRVNVVNAVAEDAQTAKQRAVEALRSMRRRIRAAAVVVDVAVPASGSSGIEVHLEHAEGPAIGVLEPYAVRGGNVSVGALEGYRTEPVIW